MNEEIKKMVHQIAGHVTEARVWCEALEMDARDDEVEDEHLEAEAYDWAHELEVLEARIDEYIAEHFSEDTDNE